MSSLDGLEAQVTARLRELQRELRVRGWTASAGRRQQPPARPDWGGRGFVYGFLGANALVFAAWWASADRPRLRRFLEDHFVLSPRNLRQGRWWTWATSALSHRAGDHLAANMYAFSVYADCGLLFGYDGAGLAALALGSALAGSAAQLWAWARDRARTRGAVLRPAALGASAVVNGLAVAVTVLRPRATATATAPGFPLVALDMPLALYTLAYFAYDYASMYLAPAASPVAHAAHVGGALFGLAFATLRRLATPSRPRGGLF